MSKPRNVDMKCLMNLGRYLKGRQRVIDKFDHQKNWKIMDTWSDTDHAGCLRTRKSTNGGVALFGNHCIKGWSTTQAVLALSSGEAEFYCIVKGASIGIGLRSVYKDLGVSLEIEMYTDSSAAKGIAHRKGLGKVRHLETNQLWIQEKVANKDIDLQKVCGTDNIADALTKYVSKDELVWHSNKICQQTELGRHSLAPQLEEGEEHQRYESEEEEEE